MRFLVLGDSGMLGHMVGLYLTEAGHEVLGASRRGQQLFPSVKLDISDDTALRKLLSDNPFDIVLNCIAITSDHVKAPEELVMQVNGYFPHRLAELCIDLPTRIIQVSTDGVFAGDNAPYADSAIPDVSSAYGRSKALGELRSPGEERHLTVRACPFGPDINEGGVGLFNWFMHAKPPVTGWTQALFTGVTTLAFARFVERAAIDGLSGLVHFAPEKSISKAELLHMIEERFRPDYPADIQDVPGTSIDRSLVPSSEVPYAVAPTYEDMLDDLLEWTESHNEGKGSLRSLRKTDPMAARPRLQSTYDFIIVGAGLFGAVVAHEAVTQGKRVCVLERRSHVGGMCRSFEREGIIVHAFGPHILHVNSDLIWNYLSNLVEIESCLISPIANYKGRVYNLPFNMNTFNQLWGVVTPAEAREQIERTRVPNPHPENLEEHVLDLVGRDIYDVLVKGYVEKQYGKPANQLPASLISRMPLLFRYDNDYCNTRHQGIPVGGYAPLFERLLEGCDIVTDVDYLADRDYWDAKAGRIVFTGQLDELFGYQFGPLEYRGRRFEHDMYDEENHQGAALVNYTDAAVEVLRTIEHRHFVATDSPKTVVTREYAIPWEVGGDPYYPIDDADNRERYGRYRELADACPNMHIGGRLAEYRYFDMEDTIASALRMSKALFG